jgi:hypothetical protein
MSAMKLEGQPATLDEAEARCLAVLEAIDEQLRRLALLRRAAQVAEAERRAAVARQPRADR